MESNLNSGLLRRVAVIGNHTPRQCGIGTFTADLIASLSSRFPSLDCFAIAMNDKKEGYDYPSPVRYQIQADDLPTYHHAAEYINRSRVDVVCLQHEYGIFGGGGGKPYPESSARATPAHCHHPAHHPA